MVTRANSHSPRRASRLSVGLAVFACIGLLATDAAAIGDDTSGPDIVTKNPTVGKQGLYVVQPGDTLWDLCDAFFSNPWYWPQLWSYNPQITNPHWIYPGDLLQMRAPKARGVRSTIVWSDSRYSQASSNLEILSRFVGYLPDRAFKSSGTIRYARETQNMLGEYDEVYIDFKEDVKVKRGERFTIYRVEGEITHPQDDDKVVGQKIRHLGVAKVLDASKNYVKALILKSYEEIFRGDLVTSIFPHSWDVSPNTNNADVVATLVDYHQPQVFGGQFMYVYIDKGRTHNIQRGNRFVIERRGDGAWYEDGPDDDQINLDDFPWERIGEVMIVETFEETSLGIVTQSIRELFRGDRLVMKKGY